MGGSFSEDIFILSKLITAEFQTACYAQSGEYGKMVGFVTRNDQVAKRWCPAQMGLAMVLPSGWKIQTWAAQLKLSQPGLIKTGKHETGSATHCFCSDISAQLVENKVMLIDFLPILYRGPLCSSRLSECYFKGLESAFLPRIFYTVVLLWEERFLSCNIKCWFTV